MPKTNIEKLLSTKKSNIEDKFITYQRGISGTWLLNSSKTKETKTHLTVVHNKKQEIDKIMSFSSNSPNFRQVDHNT